MDIVDALNLNSNPKIEINFDGGELSSDSGLFLLKEFIHQIGFTDILEECFATKDTAAYRKHSDIENLLQAMYQIIAGYFEDDRADSLTNSLYSAPALRRRRLHRSRPCPGSTTAWMRTRRSSSTRLCVGCAR